MRVTAQSQLNTALTYLRQQSSAAAKWSDQIASGLRVKVASDDPANFSRIDSVKSDSRRYETYQGTIADARNILNSSVSTLQDTNQVFTRARQLTIEGINATTEAFGYESLAVEVDGLIDRLVQTANTQVDGAYLYSGTATDTPPFRVTATDPNGRATAIAYEGSPDATQALIGPNQTVDARYAGSQIFLAGADVFQSLIQLRDNLRDPNLSNTEKTELLQTRLGEVEDAQKQINLNIADQSASLSKLEAIDSRLLDIKLVHTERLNDLQSTDFSEAVLRLREQETIFEATLSVTSRVLQTNIMDFLR